MRQIELSDTEYEVLVRVLRKVADSEPVNVRGTRVPEDWMPSAEDQFKMRQEFPNMSVDFLRAETDKFRDYYLSAPGVKGRKTDWGRAWCNWIRRGAGRAGTATERKVSGYLSRADRLAGGQQLGLEA